MDGNTSGHYFNDRSVSHTSESPLDTNPWWQVDLGASKSVDSIKLWNRTDCCSGRLRNFYVFASPTPFTSNDPQVTQNRSGVWSVHRENAVDQTLTLLVGRDVRYIRVQLVGSDRPLSLAEVQVFGNPTLRKPVSQSSTYVEGANAGRANDGNINGNYHYGSISHTSDSPLDNSPWWQVDLGVSQPVGSVKLWNRTDCCGERLRDFYVFVSDTPFTSPDPEVTRGQAGVWNHYQSAAVGTSLTLPVGRNARYIRVQLVGPDRPLSLAEVQIF